MLVCNVSLRPSRRAIAAGIAEVAAALDAATTGNVVFAALVDDPASVGEIVDAYLGEIMLEPASAADAISAGATYDAAIDEAIIAADDAIAGASYAVAVDETVTATDLLTATGYPAWDLATVASVTLSGGNLIATNTGTTSTNQGAHVESSHSQTTGKYYFEAVITQGPGGGNVGFGIGTTTSTYTAMGNSAVTGAEIYNSENIWVNGVNTGINLGALLPGGSFLFAMAVDLTNRKIWFRKGAAGNWNANASYDPATNVGGVTIPSGAMIPFCNFGGTGGGSGNSWTANFGASAFTGTVPAGFIAGWSF